MQNLRSLKSFIGSLVREAIREVAIQPHEAEGSGLALATIKSSDLTMFVLYKPELFLQIVKEYETSGLPGPGDNSVHGRLVRLQQKLGNPVVGYTGLERGSCGFNIVGSAAEKGYGPMMYDIALSFAGRAGVMPDRNEVSSEARKIWRYYATKRRGEVGVYSIPDECAMYQDDRDVSILDAKYIMKTPDLSKVEALKSKSEQVMNQAREASTFPLSPTDALRKLTGIYFNAKVL